MRFFIHASIAEILDFAPNAKLCLYEPVGGESTLANDLHNHVTHGVSRYAYVVACV